MSVAVTRPIELVGDRLYVVGATIPLDGRASFAPPVGGAFLPVNCYVIVEGDEKLIVDTGIAAVRDELLEQLATLIAPGTPVSVFLTRAEFDTVGNLGPIAETYPVKALHTGGVTNPFDAFDMVRFAGVKPLTIPAQVDRKPLRDALEFAPGRVIDMVPPAIRMITTYWAFDRATKTLFTSDAFSHVHGDDEGGAVVVDSLEPIDTDVVAAAAYAKFWFLPETHPGLIARELASVFEEFEPEIVAPAYGGVLQGRQVVQQHYEAMLAVLPR